MDLCSASPSPLYRGGMNTQTLPPTCRDTCFLSGPGLPCAPTFFSGLGETLLSIFTPKSGIGLRDDYKVRWEGWVNQKFWVRKNASQLHVSTESLANNASSRKNNFPAGNLVSPADGHGGEHPAGPPGHLDTMDPWDELTLAPGWEGCSPKIELSCFLSALCWTVF